MSFGGPMKAGYTATSYGQISQLPQIYSGFWYGGFVIIPRYKQAPGCNRFAGGEGPDGSEIYHIRCF